MMGKTNIEYQKKLFVVVHQDCDVILSHARLLNFFPPVSSQLREMAGKVLRRREKSYLNLQPRAGERTEITEITEEFFPHQPLWVSVVVP